MKKVFIQRFESMVRLRPKSPGRNKNRNLIFSLILTGLIACGETTDPAELLARGEALLASGDLPSALIELKNAVQAAPEDPQARFILGNAYLSTANAAAALKELTRARSLGMNSDELNLAVTKAMIVSGKMSEAATELALNSNQSSSAWVTLQGLLDLAVGRFEEASVELAKAIKLDPNNVDARRGAVRAAIGLGDTDQARVFVDEALAIATDDFAIWLLKGDLERHDQHFAEALEAYSKGLEIIPGSPIALLHRAAVHVASLDTEAALVDLDAIGDASNEDPRAIYLRALIARQNEQPSAALRYLRQVFQVIPNHRDSLVQAATIHFQLNEYPQAEDYLERLLIIDPANEQYRRMLSAVQLAGGRLNTDMGDMENVDIESMADPQLLALLGTAYLKHGKFADGTRSLERALELAPGSIPIRTQLAFSRMRAGKMSEALTELAAVRSEDPDFVLAGVLQAFGFAAQQQNSQALETVNELISRQPQAPIFYNVRGYLHDLFGDSGPAAADFATALDKDPSFHPASFNLARLAIKAGDKSAAKARLQSVLAHSPNQPQALVYLASMLSADGDDDAAQELWEQARTNNPTAIEPRILLARYYRKHNKLVNAENMANEAYALAPYSPAAQFEYAIMKISAGDPADALPAINSLVERYPNSVQAVELLAQVYNLMGDATALESTLVSIVEKFPDALRSHVSLARLYVSRDEFEAAEKIGNRLIVNDAATTQAAGYTLLGDIRLVQKETVAALAAFRKAHNLLPNTSSILRLDNIKRQAGELDTTLLTDWLAGHEDDTAVRAIVAMADLTADRQSEAIAHYEKILQIAPENIVALNNLAWIFDESDDQRALEYGRRAYEAAPARAEIMDTYGWILFRKGSKEQAFQLLSKAAEAAPKNLDIRYHYASAMAMADDDGGAIAELGTILATTTEFASRADAEALLAKLQQ